jgi:DNA-binding MarR family transcriptional regulator
MSGMNSPALDAVLRLLRAQAHLQNRFAAELGGIHGLSVNELLLLMHLDQAEGGRLRRVDLAERLDMSQSGVTRMLAPMEKVGWVDRAEDRRDARVSYVVLRKAGRRLAREGARTLAAQAETLFGEPWSEEDIEALSALLGRLTANLPGKLQA